MIYIHIRYIYDRSNRIENEAHPMERSRNVEQQCYVLEKDVAAQKQNN